MTEILGFVRSVGSPLFEETDGENKFLVKTIRISKG